MPHKSEVLPILTLEEHNKLKDELKFRKETLRESIKIDLIEAADLGDLYRENFPFDEAMAKQRFNESRIKDLEFLIRSSVIKQKTMKSKIIKINDTVKIQKENEEPKIVKIVTKDHFEISRSDGFVTSESPLGKALIGKKEGESFLLILPVKQVKYFILEIL